MEDQTQKLLAELIRQALIRIHSHDQGVDAALYSAINVLQEQNIINNINKSTIDEIAKNNIKPEEFVIVIAGNKYVINDELKDLGYKIKEIKY